MATLYKLSKCLWPAVLLSIGWNRYPAAPSAALSGGSRLTSSEAKRSDARVSYLPNSGEVAVVLVAHQDDWQLFMGDVVAARIRDGTRVVFIYLTAGDNGRDSSYWQTREHGALASTRIAAAALLADTVLACSSINVREHAIRKCALANTESYFFRLPDGRRDGRGFARHLYESLRKLRARRIASISSVDNGAKYAGWPDLVSTITTLVGEGSADRSVTVYTSDPSVVVNPHDHFDHRMAGLLVAEARRANKWNVVYYAGYALASRAPNRSEDQVREKVSLFHAYDGVLSHANAGWSAYREHPAFYAECMTRTYGRKLSRR